MARYASAFATLFNDIQIVRSDGAGTETERFTVPIAYASKRAWYNRLIQDPSLDKPAGIILPRLGYHDVGIVYDSSRSRNPILPIVSAINDTTYKKVYVPVPYDISYELYVMTTTHFDANQIIEQILPFFVPDFTLTLIDPLAMDHNISVPIVLGTPSKEDNYSGNFATTRQTIVWTIPFTMKSWLYGPTNTQGIIREVQIDFHIPEDMDDLNDVPRIARILTVPDPIGADPGDAYTPDTTITEYTDGFVYDPETDTDVDPNE
jgi:hypothetical protein